MLERYVHALSLLDVAAEDAAATRERLKDRFPRGATRRMTQLGLLVASVLEEVKLQADDAIVYASAFGESRAIEAYLDSFPAASPTLFQTSIHPSAVQQALIGRQQPIREFFPITGRSRIVGHALQAAFLSGASRVVLCGGEERGTWLLARQQASDRSFAFAFVLTAAPEDARARVTIATTEEPVVEFPLVRFFDAIAAHEEVDCVASPGLHVAWRWLR